MTPPGGLSFRALDLLFVAWAALWLGVAIAVGVELRGLSELSGTVGKVGRALSETGEAVGSFDDTPLVGGRLGEVGERIEQAGASASENARSSRESVDNLTLLLGLAIAVIPSLPLLGIYLPLRTAAVRDARSLRRTLAESDDRVALEDFLAQRAIQALPYRRLRRLTREPWRAPADDEERRALAGAELERAGLRRSLLEERA